MIMKERKYVKDMDDKEFLEKYASKKAMDDAEKRMHEKLRKEKIVELDEGIKRVAKYLEKKDPELYHTALAELGHIKAEIDFYHSKGARLTKEDFDHYNNKVKSEVRNIIETVEHKLSKANAAEQKVYKEVIEEARGYMKKGTETAKPVLEKIEKVFTPEKFQKDVQYLKISLQKETDELKKHKERYKSK